jgi:hypothetical protein
VDPVPPSATAPESEADPLLGALPEDHLVTDSDIEPPSFGGSVPPRSAPAVPSAFAQAGSEAVGEGAEELEPPPMTATEAFLRSNRLEEDRSGGAEQHPIPSGDVEDDTDPAPARMVHSVEREDDLERDPAEPAEEARPLGWLFRSPQ